MTAPGAAEELRPIAELFSVLVTGGGDLVAELQPLLAEGWWLVQVFPQPQGGFVCLLQRRKLRVETGGTTDRIMALVRP
jgi:hypothetical protein